MMRDTLVIKRFPDILTNADKEDLLKYFGAVEVKCLSSTHTKYSLTFAKFQSEAVAENVLHRLHQLPLLGSHLSVEYARGSCDTTNEPEQIIKDVKDEENEKNEKYYKQFLDKLNSWHSPVNLRQPVPNHLKYQYPPPTAQVLLNIGRVLATVPKFYTQVLHLMNKMNLPCPFGKELLPHVDLGIYFPETTTGQEHVLVVEEQERVQEDTTVTSESELSTDDEGQQHKEIIPETIKIKKTTKIKRAKFIKPVVSEGKRKKGSTKFEDVFEKIEKEPTIKKIKLSHPPLESLHSVSADKSVMEEVEVSSGGFGFIHPVRKPEESAAVSKPVRDEREEERLEKEEVKCITKEELSSNRISEKDRGVLPVFKNYAEGAPTCRLYIKNLAKTVTNDDLNYIYKRYIDDDIEEPISAFDVRLMTEGRMKGQAFVTLQTVELAEKALHETNGFILKDKPMVVQFARSATK